MSLRSKNNGGASTVSSASSLAREKAAQVGPLAREKASQAVPLAKSAGAAAMHGADELATRAKPHVHRARKWAAPRVERTGKAVEEKVAPQVSAMMTKAARRLDPERKSRRHARLARGVALLAAAASASAVVALLRKKGVLPDIGGTGAADADPGHSAGDQGADAHDPAATTDANGRVTAS
jgi:hypothetical protein